MTKEETLTIMALLNAFYAGGKNDPKQQATAWHMILGKYDYNAAREAVLEYAENDVRDYATFPAVGKIVEVIKAKDKERMKPLAEIKLSISYGKKYDDMPVKCKSIISREMYDTWLNVNPEEFEARSDEFISVLKNDYNRRLIAGV